MKLSEISPATQKASFWTLTILISLFFFISGYMELTKNPATYIKTLKMGYPPYFIALLGLAKVVGAVVLLIPKLRLQTWVFAAFTIDVIFAFFSGYATESYADCIKAGIVFAFLMLSYRLFVSTDRAQRLVHAAVK